jgi:hypothetical protein
MSTEQQRQQWRELAAAATPGDWQFGGYHDLDDYDVHVFDGDNVTYIAQSCYDIDAYFIAAARAAVPHLWWTWCGQSPRRDQNPHSSRHSRR